MSAEEKAIRRIFEACQVLGWKVYFEKGDDDAKVEGVLIGTTAFLNRITAEEGEQ